MSPVRVMVSARVMPDGKYAGPSPKGGVYILHRVSEPVSRPIFKEARA